MLYLLSSSCCTPGALLGTSACSGGDLWQLPRLKCGLCSFLHKDNQPACFKMCQSSFSSPAAVYFCWSPFNLGFPPVTSGSDDRRAVTADRLWDGISVLMGDEPASHSGSERKVCLDLLVYKQYIISSLNNSGFIFWLPTYQWHD